MSKIQLTGNVSGTGTVTIESPNTNSDSTITLPAAGGTLVTTGSISAAVTPTAVSDQLNSSTGYFDLPAGTTGERPGSPATGMIRYNSTLGRYEGWGGSDWIALSASFPGAPTIGTATVASATSVSVAFTAPSSDGGSAITGYTATSSPGAITGTGASSPITVSGLTTGTAYTFTVT